MTLNNPSQARIELDLEAQPPSRRISAPQNASPPDLVTRLRALPEVTEIIGLSNRFASNPERAIAIYNEDPYTLRGGLIGGDDLVGVMQWTAQNPLLSYRFSGEAVAFLPMRMFRQRMSLPVASPDECVLITMGMPACGKTTLVRGGMGRAFHTVVDSPLASFETARELRRVARESGRKVAFVFAHRPLKDAVQGMLERALPWREGRVVSLENMGSILVKGLALFLELANLNPADDGTTLDLVEVLNGRRHWFFGTQAARRVEEIRTELSASGESALIKLVRHWVEALRDAQKEGLEIPDLLIDLVQEDLDPRMLCEAEASPKTRVVTAPPEAELFSATIRSLSDCSDTRQHLDRWAEVADLYEATLRNWRITGLGPKGMPVSDPAVSSSNRAPDLEPHRVDFRSERGFQGFQRLLAARGQFSTGPWDAFAPTSARREEVMFWFLLGEDPLITVWDHLPPEVKETFPPLQAKQTNPLSAGILEERMERLKRIAALFLRDEDVIVRALMRMI